MNGDKAIRRSTIAAVAVVGAVAAVLSFRHQYELALAHGESTLTARLLPASIDGLLLAGTLAILDGSRHGHRAWAARVTVGLGVSMTLWANIVHGVAYGKAGIIVSGWPPVALIAVVEVLARMLRSTGSTVEPVAQTPTQFASPVPADAQAAAKLALAASVAAGNPISQRQMMARFGLTRTAESKVRQAVLAESNGHAPNATASTEGGEH